MFLTRGVRASLVVLALVLVGCSKNSTAPDDGMPNGPRSVVIDGKSVELRADLVRNFMPITPEGGAPLSARVVAYTANGSNFPDGVEIVRLWVGNGFEVWSAEPDPIESIGLDQMPVFATGGPTWEPGIRVALVAELRRGTRVWRVRAEDPVVQAVH